MSRTPTRIYPRLSHRLPPFKRYSNYCLWFDGATHWAQRLVVPYQSSGALEIWMRPDASMTPPAGGVRIINTGPPVALGIQAGTGIPFIQLNYPIAGFTALVATTPLVADVWQRIAGSWEWDGVNTTQNIYRNGLVDAVPLVTAEQMPAGVAASLDITNNFTYNGYIDEFNFSPFAPSPAQMWQRFLHGYALDGNTILAWRLEEGSGIIAIDTSGKTGDLKIE